MKQLPTLASAFLVCLFGVAGAWAQAPTPRTPTVDEILGRYIAVMGGQAALEKLTSYTIRGTLQYEDVLMIGKIEMYGKTPNKTVSIFHFPNLGVLRRGYDGAVGWTQGFGENARELAGEELDDARLDADFYGQVDFRKIYPDVKLLGKEKLGARDVYVLAAKPAQGSLRKFYFDVEKGLLSRRDDLVLQGGRREPVQTYYEDYREVDGIKFAYRFRVVSSRVTSLMRMTSIQINAPIEDSIFAMPKAP